MAPAVNAVLPPRSASGARSSTSTSAPRSRAARAAHMAALPPPTTITSAPSSSDQDGAAADIPYTLIWRAVKVHLDAVDDPLGAALDPAAVLPCRVRAL